MRSRTTLLRPTARAAALSLGAAALLAGAPGAATAAALCQGAPGTSAVEQYCEAIPSADGRRNTPQSGNGKPGSPSTISKKTGAALAAAGADGAAIDRLAESVAPPAATGGSTSGKATGGSGPASSGTTDAGVAGPSDPSGSPLKAATEAVQAGPTVGAGLAWGVVGMSALGAIGALALRRRGGFSPPSDSETDES